MSVNSFQIEDNPKGYGQSYNQLADMYRQAIQNRHFKTAREIEQMMDQKDKELAKQGES